MNLPELLNTGCGACAFTIKADSAERRRSFGRTRRACRQELVKVFLILRYMKKLCRDRAKTKATKHTKGASRMQVTVKSSPKTHRKPLETPAERAEKIRELRHTKANARRERRIANMTKEEKLEHEAKSANSKKASKKTWAHKDGVTEDEIADLFANHDKQEQIMMERLL
ncbi:hypothetical protein K505DRAFT_339196 [Melanomma pulvis-pyrius CBS 109.77]|uniref:Uncharacterized protein n=1 Tax=Melanomma pulvis-pyrius CBS 109.77 TaxID=1314802 RepID=A0A6A6X7I3_9PLEO|nr:hypothetical protein K505DRAFT_339196 [Melanomma pulvis-pyrius CBS 109.77]